MRGSGRCVGVVDGSQQCRRGEAAIRDEVGPAPADEKADRQESDLQDRRHHVLRDVIARQRRNRRHREFDAPAFIAVFHRQRDPLAGPVVVPAAQGLVVRHHVAGHDTDFVQRRGLRNGLHPEPRRPPLVDERALEQRRAGELGHENPPDMEELDRKLCGRDDGEQHDRSSPQGDGRRRPHDSLG